MKSRPGFLLGVLLLPGFAPSAALENHVWQEDFESGTTSAWESYPPFQDTAYDFTIYPGSFIPPSDLRGGVFSGGEYYPPSGLAPPDADAGGEFYLMRGQKPEGAQGQRLGMWCKIPHLWSSESLAVAMDYWLEDRLDNSTLEVHLAGGDGIRYVASVESHRRQWTRLELSRSDFVSHDSQDAIPVDVSIDAIAVVMDMEQTDPTAYAYIAIDNVRIEGRRQVPIEYNAPQVVRYKHWKYPLVEQVGGPDDAFSLDVSIPLEISNLQVDLAYVKPEDVRHSAALSSTGQSWSLAGGIDFADDDPFGPWIATLRAETRDGDSLQESIRFWRLKEAPLQRPRLLFSAGQVDDLRERATDGGRGQDLYNRIRANAERVRGTLPPEEADIGVYFEDYLLRDIGSYFAVLRTPSYDALNNAFVYTIDQDEEAGQYAREVLLRMASWETWTHPNFPRLGRTSYYPVGIVANNLAIAYDMVHPLLSEDDKRAIREGIHRNAIHSTWNEYFLHNRVASHTSNWITGVTGGATMSVLSMYDTPSDFPPEFVGVFEKWLAHLDATWLPDGSYGEGYGYHGFAAYKGAPAMAALGSAFGATELPEAVYFHEAYLFPIYATVGERTILAMGDNYGDLSRALNNAAWSVHATGDPVLNHWFQRNPGTDWREFVWPIDPEHVTPPGEVYPPSRLFPDRGAAILRTDWDDGVAVHYRAGPNFNHTHDDQGHFLLWAHGETLAGEGGLSSYYEDPYFWTYYIHAGAHNVLIIDGNIQSQELGDFDDEIPAFNNHARMTATAIGETAGLVRSDLTPAYRRHLSDYERAVAFTPGGNFIVWDRIESNGGTHQFDLYYHPPAPNRTEIGSRGAVYTGEGARLSIQSLQPEGVTVSQRRVPTRLAELRDHPNPPAERQHVVTIGTNGPSNSASFLTAYLPSRLNESEGVAHLVDIPGGSGVRIVEGDSEVVAFLGTNGITMSPLESDASMLMMESVNGNPTRIWALGARSLSIHGDSIHESEAPENLILHLRDDGTWNRTAP